MDRDMEVDAQNSAHLFRPAKRRKFYRKRNDSDKGGKEIPEALSDSSISSSEPMTVDELIARKGNVTASQGRAEKEPPLSIANILRQRKGAQRRRGGIEFTNLNPSSSSTSQPSDALIAKENGISPDIRSVIERFVPQTGQITEGTDKHLNVVRMAYIDAELAKRQRQNQYTPTTSHYGQELSPSGALLDAGLQRQPAAMGKLHEVDLGPDATQRNIARTEAAQRKLEGVEPEIDRKTGKVRLRKDGKPYGWRKRRNSDDVTRDKLVEEVMRESRLEIYDEPDEEGEDGDQAADDRIAEQFRREFMDVISSRKQKALQEKKPVKGKVIDDRPKGPKLGGSRSARAAMRGKEEAAAKKR